MEKTYWTGYQLKKLGMNHKSAKAFLRVQGKQMYHDKKYEELKNKIRSILAGFKS